MREVKHMDNEKYESRVRIRSNEPVDVTSLTRAVAKFGRVSSVSSEKAWSWSSLTEEENE
jgi:hypothetical protein